MQRNMDTFSSACDAFGLTISIKKTEVMSQPAPHTNYSDPTIKVKDQKMQTVDKFSYLGSTLSRNMLIDDKVDARITKASTFIRRLHKNVWERKDSLNLQNKAERLQSCSHYYSPLCLLNIVSLL